MAQRAAARGELEGLNEGKRRRRPQSVTARRQRPSEWQMVLFCSWTPKGIPTGSTEDWGTESSPCPSPSCGGLSAGTLINRATWEKCPSASLDAVAGPVLLTRVKRAKQDGRGAVPQSLEQRPASRSRGALLGREEGNQKRE